MKMYHEKFTKFMKLSKLKFISL